GAVKCGEQASLEAAVGLYRGPLLEDCAEEWVIQERESREQAYLGALQSLALAATRRGDSTMASAWLRRALIVDPFREDMLRSLMEALVHVGDPSAALLAYRELRALLRREMSTEPAPETT